MDRRFCRSFAAPDNATCLLEVSTVIAFEVRVNGQLLCTAGHDDIAVLNTMINCQPGDGSHDVNVWVGGLTKGIIARRIRGRGEHVRWLESKSLSLGDEISIRIVDVPECDPPKSAYLY